MKATTHRIRGALVTVAVGCGLAVVLPSAPAHAATVYTFTGAFDSVTADHHSWTDPENWSPMGVPGDGDAVVVPAVDGFSVHLDAVPDVTLASLSVLGDEDVELGEGGEQITVTGSFTWTGGEIYPDVVLAHGATGQVAAGVHKQLWGDLVDHGVLTLDDIGDQGVQLEEAHRIVVAADGRLVSTGTNGLTYDRCCTTPDRVVDQGEIDVLDGSLTLDKVELDQSAYLHVAGGAVMRASGVARLAAGSRYDGAGALVLEDTDGPSPDPQHPDATQGGVLLDGTMTLQNGFHIVADSDSEIDGVGAFGGIGSVTLHDTVVYADLTLGSGVALAVAPGAPSYLDVWDPDLRGYHAKLTLHGPAKLAPGSHLTVSAGTTTHLTRGASLVVPGRATIDSLSCCTTTPELVTDAGSSLTLGGGSGRAVLRWITVRTRGTMDVPAQAGVKLVKTTYVHQGGTATLGAGSTLTTADTSYLLRGGTLQGRGRISGELVNSHGVVAPGTTGHDGTLTVGSYRQSGKGVLALHVGARHDQLVATGSARLGGTIKVTGARPRHGHRVVVVRARHLGGRAKHVRAPHWRVVYGPRALSLVGR